jgi:hypothetical protein
MAFRSAMTASTGKQLLATVAAGHKLGKQVTVLVSIKASVLRITAWLATLT